MPQALPQALPALPRGHCERESRDLKRCGLRRAFYGEKKECSKMVDRVDMVDWVDRIDRVEIVDRVKMVDRVEIDRKSTRLNSSH